MCLLLVHSHFTFLFFFFFFNDTATTEIYPLSLHDALPICGDVVSALVPLVVGLLCMAVAYGPRSIGDCHRSEEHTSELQSLAYLVCRLLLEKKKIKYQK